MNVPALIVGLAVALSVLMGSAWVVAIRSGKSGWVDAIWSLSVGLIGAIAALVPIAGGAATPRPIVVAAMAALWSLRLGLHIVRRTLRGKDDPRYVQLRDEWGENFQRKFFWFLQIQAAAAFLLVLTIFIAAHNPSTGLRLGDGLGILVLLIAVSGEAIADRQLAQFGADPANKSKVCTLGLWSVSRHPNYFFEWLGWLSYVFIAVDWTHEYPWGWLALIGPVFMYWLLVHVSGIPPLEAHMLRSRGNAFRVYQARVNAFWPGPARAADASDPHGSVA